MNFVCKVTLVAVLAIVSALVAAEASKPSKAEIVSAPAEQRGYEMPIGNVKVTFDDGHTEMWTKKGRCMLPKVSQSGIVGWSFFKARNRYDEPENVTLRLLVTENDVRDFNAGAFIEDWWLTDGDTIVIIKSRGRHGSAYYGKYDIGTSRELDAAFGDWSLPEWAKPYSDQAQSNMANPLKQ